MNKMELRSESRLSVSNDELHVEGLVNKTNSWSKVLGHRKKFRERVLSGVFKAAIEAAERVDFLSEHNKNLLLATTDNGSLEVWEDSEGLQMRSTIAPTSYGRDIHTLIKEKIVSGMSFGFKVLEDSWKRGDDGIYLRTIHKLSLGEVSAVRNAAYNYSGIEARGIEVVEDVEIPNLEKEEKGMTEEMKALKAELKAEILAELKAEKESPAREEVEPNAERASVKDLIEAEAKEEALENKLEAKEDKLEMEAEAKTLEEVVKKRAESPVEEAPIVETAPASDIETTPIIDVEVVVSESVEVTLKEEQPDGSIKETSEEVTVKKTVTDEELKNNTKKLLAMLKENSKKRY